MPLYEYRCWKCEKKFEVIQKFADAPLTGHAGCGGAVERLLTAPSFHLKGSAWYATDYAKSGKAEEKNGSKDAATPETKAPDEKSATAPSESKPAAESKTESKPAPTPAKSD